MKKYVLFSPIGSTDPVTNFRDGSMLHICRKYKPCAVMLFLSSEMAERQKNDDRYVKAIEMLEKEEDFKTEIILEERPDLKNVQDFEICFKEFRPLLEKLHKNYPDSEMLINIASGTPAMKGTLYMLASFLPFKVTLVQTSTPLKEQNPRRGVIKDYDVELFWESNLDNDKKLYEDRCAVVKNPNLTEEIQKENIRDLIDGYEYSAALKIAEKISPALGGEVTELIKRARDKKAEGAFTSSAERIEDKLNEFPEFRGAEISAHKLFAKAVKALNESGGKTAVNENEKNACEELNEQIKKALDK